MEANSQVIQSMLESAWLPKRAVKQDSSCKLRSLAPQVPFIPEFRDAIQFDVEGVYDGDVQSSAVHEAVQCQTCAVTPCGGHSYNVVYGIIRHLVLKGVAAKVVHVSDLADPPEYRNNIEFMPGLESCEVLGVLGFYDSNEPKPSFTGKVSHLLRELDCSLLLETSDRLDDQDWWTIEFIESLGEVDYLISQ